MDNLIATKKLLSLKKNYHIEYILTWKISKGNKIMESQNSLIKSKERLRLDKMNKSKETRTHIHSKKWRQNKKQL